MRPDITAQKYGGPALPHAYVTLEDAFSGKHRLDVEVADTPASRERGLMWRTSLAPTTGMLFVFPFEEVQSFWMRNTLISLDMLFITRAGVVAGIVENAEPQTLKGRSVGRPTLYVLEVPGGWSAKQGIRAGSHVGFEGLPLRSPE